MALNAGEVEVLLKLRDELSEKLRMAKAELKDVGITSSQVGDTVKKTFGPSSEELGKLYGQTVLSDKAMREHLGSSNNLTTSMRAFDGVLGSVGIHLGPEIKAIGELGGASGKTALELGLISTAGLAIGAGMVAWKITRATMEFFNLDKSVEGAWTQLLGFNDVASETAGATMDVLARASANAGREITSMAEAVRINEEAFARDRDKKIDWTSKLADAQREARRLTEAQIQGIEIAQRAGATTEEITHKYGISAEGLKALADRQKTSAEMQSMLTARMKEGADVGLIWGSGMAGAAADIDALDAAARDLHAQGLVPMIDTLGTLVTNFDELDPEMSTYIDQLERASNYEKAVAEDARLMAAGLTDVSKEATDAAKKMLSFSEAMDLVRRGKGTMSSTIQKMSPEEQAYSKAVNEILKENALFTTDSQRERIAKIPKPEQSFAAGGPTKEGPAYVHDGEYVVPKNGALVMSGSGSGKNTMIVQLVMADGRELASAVVPWFPGELRRIGVA